MAKSAITSIETSKKTPSIPPADAGGEGDGLFDTPVEEPTAHLRAVPSEAALDAEFDRFWSLYPRREGKRAARTAYGRARRTATVEQVAAGLHRVLPEWNARIANGERRFVPHPTTWLNQGRWDDEVVLDTRAETPVRPRVADPGLLGYQ